MTDSADRTDPGRADRHAVVIGGSVAGLLAAQVLSEYADRVTVVERDTYPDGIEQRSGVPQGRHLHVLLAGGQQALEELLPGACEQLRREGAPSVGMPGDLAQWQLGRWYRRTPASVYLSTGSRPLTEAVIRRRVLANPRISALPGSEVTGLLGDATRVSGVLLRERGAAATGTAPRQLTASLVVDASGRGSLAPRWLAGIGAEAPREETIDTGLAYASRVYSGGMAAAPGPDLPGYYVVPHPGQTYGAVLLPLEEDRWLVTLSGLRGQEPPTDEEGFLKFAARLPHPAVHDWMATAKPESPVYGFRQTANVRRRYDLPGRRPAGFLAIGDALCTFNPIYGQGMTVAAQSALALRTALDPAGRPATRRVQRALLGAAQQAWDISAGSDRTMPGAVGSAAKMKAADRSASWYLTRVMERAPGDPVVGDAFRAVLSLTAPVAALFAPRIALAVMRPPLPTAPEPSLTREAAGPPADSGGRSV